MTEENHEGLHSREYKSILDPTDHSLFTSRRSLFLALSFSLQLWAYNHVHCPDMDHTLMSAHSQSSTYPRTEVRRTE